ncbi:MAG: glutathione peroxidase [Bacteroidota bacterium]
MKKVYLYSGFAVAIIFCALSCGFKQVSSRPDTDVKPPEGSIYDFKMVSIGGDTIDLSIYKGKKLLIVNTASECGYTPQYKDLQKLHKQYGDKITILGFPANNFGGQEPGTDEEIASFCELNYGVTFQMFSKISVKGDDMHSLYQWLSDANKNGWNNEAPNWNFCKYLVNEKGELLKFYASGINPMSEEFIKDIR